MPVQSIEDVITSLSEIIDDSVHRNSRLGFFPAMYRKVTLRVAEGIRHDAFEDNQRMEHLDVVFANRYIEAFQRYRSGRQPTRSWAFTFEMAESSYPMVIQHLLLGMNAHINLDLGIAAAEVSRGQDIESLKDDFFAINEVLAGLLNEVQDDVNESSPLFNMLDRLGGQIDEALGRFSIRHARRAAWEKAQELHNLPPAAWEQRIDEYDQEVAHFARILCPSLKVSNKIMQTISQSEIQEPRQIIEELRQ